jgi:hypothetical protein
MEAVLDVVGVVLELLVLLEVGFRHFEIEYNSKNTSPCFIMEEEKVAREGRMGYDQYGHRAGFV